MVMPTDTTPRSRSVAADASNDRVGHETALGYALVTTVLLTILPPRTSA